MRVVLDTNVLISAIFWRGSPYKVLLSALKKEYQFYLSSAILGELKEKLTAKFRYPEDKTKEFLSLLSEFGNIIEPAIKLSIIKDDPDDDRFLECAVSCKADFIVSGDNHLLKL